MTETEDLHITKLTTKSYRATKFHTFNLFGSMTSAEESWNTDNDKCFHTDYVLYTDQNSSYTVRSIRNVNITIT